MGKITAALAAMAGLALLLSGCASPASFGTDEEALAVCESLLEERVGPEPTEAEGIEEYVDALDAHVQWCEQQVLEDRDAFLETYG